MATPQHRAQRGWLISQGIARRLVLIGVAVALVVLVDASGLLPQRGAFLVDDLAQLAAAAFAAVCCVVAARRVDGYRRAWRILMAIGMFGWCLGQAVWTWYRFAQYSLLPSPSPSDIGFLLLPLFAFAALIVMGSRETRRAPFTAVPVWVMLALDGLIILGSLFVVAALTTLNMVAQAGADTRLALVVAYAYPVTDVLLVAMVLLLMSTQSVPLRRRPSLVLLGLGVAALSISDSVFAVTVARGGAAMPTISDAGFIAGPLLIGAAALSIGDVPPEPTLATGAKVRWANLLLPYLPMVAAGALSFELEINGHEHQLIENAFLFPVIVLVVLRQIVLLADNSVLLGRVVQAQATMRDMAYHDPLTGVANRALLDERLSQVGADESGRQRLTLFYLDLDNFKSINDALGHAGGDRVLQAVAERLASFVRDKDMVARLGGDEFGVLVDRYIADPRELGQRLLRAVSQPLEIDGVTVTVSASIGAAYADAGQELNKHELLRLADEAMYAGKKNGKNRIVLQDQSPNS